MVGVAGKSKACDTCRRRRVKCDQRRPTCERCEKGNHECEGYARKRVWIDEGARTVRLARRKRPWEYLETDLGSSNSQQDIPVSLGLEAFHDNIYVSYLLAKLFRGGIMCITWNWLRSHAENSSSAAAQYSLRALSTAYFGRMHGQRKVMSASYVLYGKALKSLNEELRDPDMAWRLSVMTSAMSLEIYEFLVLSTLTGWLQHAGGIARMIELRGPRRHQNLYERHLLEINRMTICFSYLLKRKRCFLEQPEWLKIPWALDPSSKTAILRLMDILCCLPGLVEDTTNLKLPNIPPEAFQFMQSSLLDQILVQMHALFQWREEWETDNPHSSHELTPVDPPSAVFGLGVEPVFPSILNFADLICANGITMYNAILLFLLRLGAEAIGPDFESTISVPPIPQNRTNTALIFPGETFDEQVIASEICKSVQYHLMEEHDSAGPFYLIFPMRMAYQTFGPASKEANWLQAVMRHVSNLSGFEISRKVTAQKPLEYTSSTSAYKEVL